MSVNQYLSPGERRKLNAVRVGIAGAGGLGSNCAMHLVRSGVTHLTVVDFDVVSESNLNRQFYFRDQVGMKKVEALKANLLRIDSGADVRAVDKKLDEKSLSEVFSDCDVVVEALDTVEAKAMLLSTLAQTGKNIVTASGMAGWGRSNEMRVHLMGATIVVVGDCESEVSESAAPHSPRVGIAAAMEANSVVALLLGEEV